MAENKILEGSSYILNPIANVNGYLTSADEIYDLEQGQSQAELNKLIKLSSGVSEIQEFYAVYNSPVYNGDGDMREDTINVHWIQVPSPSGEEFPTMTPEKPYLWNYEKFIQTGGEVISTEPHVTGVLGRGLKTTSRFYLVDSQSDIKPGSTDERWSLQSPPTTDSHPYLWEKQEIYYSDNATVNSGNPTPDEIVITLIGVKGESGIDGTQIEYIFCFGSSRVDAPVNPTPTGDGIDFKTDEEYQQADYIPYPRISDYNPGVEGSPNYYWSDEPVGVSKDNPAQWICKRELIKSDETGERYWDAFSDPKLYSTYGEDGVSIEKIEVRYLISAENTLTEEIENAIDGDENDDPKQPNYWYLNSPAVNYKYKYLWKKTITSYSAAGIDNPDTESDETKIKTSYSFEVIGSMGDPGIDGDSVEWIYTRTKTSDRPELDSNSFNDKYTDFQKSDFIPYPRIEDYNEGLSDYYWSDDIQAVDDIYIYGWRSQRKKSKNPDGTQTWKNFSLPVQILYKAQDGVSPNASFKSIIFIRSNENPGRPSSETEGGFNTYENPIAPGWSDGIPNGTDALWSSTRIFSTDGKEPQQANWTDPQIMTDTPDVEIIYCARENYIDPNNIEIAFSKENNEINSAWIEQARIIGWYDEPNEVELDSQKTDPTAVWMAISHKTSGQWSKWDVSKIKGEKGNDGTSIKVSGHYDKLSEFKDKWVKTPGNPDEGIKDVWYSPDYYGYTEDSCFVVEGNLWVWDGSDEWSNVGQFKGDPGQSQFLHVVYSNVVETRVDETTGEEYVYIELTEPNGTVPGKYITTWSDEFSSTDTSLETLASRIWTKWLGDDGYGYEYIYKLTSKNDPPKLPTQNIDQDDFVPSHELDTDVNYGWSDNPQSVSPKKPFCWQAYRVKIDGKWGEWKGHSDSDEAALWSKYGKDGRGINSISYWFCIDDIENYEEFSNSEVNYEYSETLPSDTASPKTWYNNSPAVTDEYKYLWKKIITEYVEETEDGTQGLETQTVLELIGIKGAKGVDGNDIEWAFKLTKDFSQPTSITDSDKWPTGEITSQDPGEWTDDALDVSEDWQYQWVIKRSKINGTWTPWGTQAVGDNGEVYYKSTLNNTYGNHIKDTESYYIVSNVDKILELIPEQGTNLENYKESLINLGWQNSTSGETIVPDPINDKLYEISIFIFTDNTYTISGPVVKGMWVGTDIQSTVFCRSSNKPIIPSGGSYDSPYPEDINTDGSRKWSDGIPEKNVGESTTIWSSTAVFIPGATSPKNGWSDPIQLTDTASLQIRYSEQEQKPENNPPTENDGVGNGWIKVASENAIWMATRSFSYGEWEEWQVLKVKGETGKDSAHPNLFLNSGFENEEDPFMYWNIDSKNEDDYSLSEKTGEQGVNGISGKYDLSYNITDRIIPGETYTISFRLSFMSRRSVKIDLGELIKSEEYLLNYSIENLNGPNFNGGLLVLTPNDDNFVNRKVFFTFKTDDSLENGEQLIFKLISNDEIYGYTTHSLKLETGSVVTDYSRAQEDLRGKDGKDGSDGKDGTSPIYADLDNEMDSVGLTSNGLADNDYTNISTNVRLWYGTLPLQLKENIEEGIKLSGVPAGISCNKTYDENRHSCEIKFSVSKGTAVAERNAIKITLVSVDEITRDLTFTLNGIKAGSDGTPAKLYRIQPTVNQIIRDQNGNLFPTAISCNTILSVGGELTENPEGVTLNYYVDDNSEIAGSVVNGSLIQLDDLEITKSIKFVLIENSSNKTVDTETVVIISEGKDGEPGASGTSPIYADLDNEMDSIPLSYLGLVEKDTKLTTNVSMWKGIEKLQLTSLSADLTTGKSGSIVFEDGDIDLESGRITCTIYKDTELDSRNIVTIYLSAANEDRILTFTINGVKAGSKGENAKIYRLSPTSSQIIRKNDGSTEPQNLTIHAIRTVGNEIISSEDDKIVEGEITYIIDGVEQALTLAPGGIITGDLLKTINRSLKLVYKVSGTLVDSETIPVIRDGIDGKGSVTVDIDNEMDSIALDHLGYPTSTDPIVTHVRLWLGTEERTIKDITAGDLGGFDKEVYLSGNPATVGTVIFTPNGEVISSRNVSTISLVDTEGIDRSVTFTISAVRSGEDGTPAKLYKIQTSHNQIKRDNQNNFIPEVVDCSYIIVEGENISTEPTDDVKFRYYIDGVLQEITATTLSIRSELISKSLKLELIKTDSENNTVIVDSETIPVIFDGKDGVTPQSQYTSIVFALAVNVDGQWKAPEAPEGGSYNSPVPTGWSDGIPENSGAAPIYSCKRRFTSDELSPQEPSWSTPQLLSDSADFDVEYCTKDIYDNLPSGHPNTNTEWENIPSTNAVWMATSNKTPGGLWSDWVVTRIKGEKGEQGIQGLQGLQGEKGERGIEGPAGADGKPSYFHIKYANDSEGTGMNDTGGDYMGTYVDNVEEDSDDPGKYNWVLTKGAQGQKGDQGIRGENGADGTSSYLHIAYANSADGSDGFDVSDSINKSYIGQYVDNVEDDSTDPQKYKWTKIEGPAGTSPIFADINNEMDSVALTADGKIASTTKLTTNVSLFRGNTKQNILSIEAKAIEGSTTYLNGTDIISCEYYGAGVWTGNITVTLGSGNSLDTKNVIKITLGDGSETRELYFTINGIKAAKDGTSPILCKLQPSVNQIVKLKSGGTNPSSNITCTFTSIQDGKTITNPTDYKIYYSINGGNSTLLPTGGISPTSISNNIKFTLKNGSNTILDTETIPVITEAQDGKDGIDGLSPIINILDGTNFDSLDKWTTSMGEAKNNIYVNLFSGGTMNNVLSQNITGKLKPSTWYTLSFKMRGWSEKYEYPISTLIANGKSWSDSNHVVDANTPLIINGVERPITATGDLVTPSLCSLVWRTEYRSLGAYEAGDKAWKKCTISFKTLSEDLIANNYEFFVRQWAGEGQSSYIELCEIKLEENNLATPWTASKNDLVGPAGTSGRNMYPAGNWDSTRDYKIENNSVPFVFYNDIYYILTANSSGTGTENAPDRQPEKWGRFEYTPFQFSEFLMAKWAKFGGQNGAVFYDKYLFSQYGYTNDTGIRAPYWDYENVMFDENGNLTNVFTPKLHLDFYNGLANLSCLCEPYVTPQESSDEPGVIRISPEIGFNIKIPCNCPDQETSLGNAQPMLHPIVVLPNLDDEESQSTWAFDGAHITILFEPGGQKYGNLSGPYASKIDKQNVFLLVCTDLSTSSDKEISIPDGTYNQNLIFCNNKRGKYLILSPGSMVKLKVNIIEENGNKYLHWIVENSGSVKEESVNIYNTSKCVSNSGGTAGKVILNSSSDSLIKYHGADYQDYVNLAATNLPDAWGLMFYSGPDGFCPKNILFSEQKENGVRSDNPNYRYHYRVLDFIGKTGNYGSPLNPPDQANGFTDNPLI